MRLRVLLRMAFPAVALATIVTVASGERQAVSLQVWLACFVAGFAVSALLRLRDRAPFAPDHRWAMFRLRAEVSEPVASRDRRLRLLEGLLLRSRDNPRSFSQQLQPQLADLAAHFLRVNHGVDLDRGHSSTAVLGELAWLIEPQSGSRTPTLEELDRFVHVLVTPTGSGAV